MNVVVIEDEYLAREELLRVIRNNFPDMKVSGCFGSVEESVRWFSANRADLIFMDVHLSDGICFDIFRQVELRTPVIFTTAYDRYAIQAFKVNGVGYLLKPLDEGEFVETVNRFRHNSSDISRLLEYFGQERSYKSRIVVRETDAISFLKIEDVAYFFAEDRLTFAVMTSGKKYIVEYTMESLAPLLDPKSFFRVSRGCIASINSIRTISKYFNGRLLLTLAPEYGRNLLVSRARVPDFMKWLEGDGEAAG